ncbi:MAG: tRNA-dependent cyclodipeptide synthase [Ferruginibacter sp.]
MIKNHLLKSPKYYPKRPDWNQKVYMPVSMNNRLLRDEKSLQEILRWVFEHTDHLEAVIGDFLHRHNLMIAGATHQEAIEKSIHLGDELTKNLLAAMQYFPGKQLSIRPSSLFYKTQVFEQRLSHFENLYMTNPVFISEIDFLIHQFLSRQGHIDGNSFQLEHCKKYLLEELVIFEILAEEGVLINVYPGKQLRIFKKIVTGELPGVSTELEKVSLVEMRFRPNYLARLIKK